ncbi:MAG TPA: protein kinase [Ktedonobacteraceae bacterium]|nr:protein kinase [Ktedonobacteraceae bacterium]
MLNQFDGRLIGGRYEVREHIATGGMASVFKTWDHRVERFVAIKVLRSLDKNDLKAVERFRREARAAASLIHSNAVTIFDFFEEASQYYLVMEYIHGPTLKQLIGQRRHLHPHETLEIASQVCSVLHVAHNRGFIHRDIKPQNIMLASSGASINNAAGTGNLLVKLTDFGIVRVAEEAGLTNSGIVLGTADYLSPEQARGEKLSASSDLYSLGVVMFEMLTGRPPFTGPTAVSIAMQHASTNPPAMRQVNPNVNIPAAVEQIVMKTLEKEPEDRFLSASEMRQALHYCVRELYRSAPTTTAAPASPTSSTPSTLSSQPPLTPPGYGGQGGYYS